MEKRANGRIRRELEIPLVCSLQDEDTWIDSLGERGSALAWRTLRERTTDVDMFVAVSGYYARLMAERMAIRPGRLAVVPIGIDVAGFPAVHARYTMAEMSAGLESAYNRARSASGS